MSAKTGSTSTTEAVSEITDTTKLGIGSAPVAGRISFAASVASLIFLAALHLLSPEFDPAWRMVSEYALGDYSWVLALMFLVWALSCIALFFAIRSQTRTIGGKIGLGFLLLSALGMIMAALFDVNHNLHGLAAMIGIPSLPIAAILISVSLIRNPAWASAHRLLLRTAILTWVSLVLMNVAVFTGFSQSSAQISPDAWVGWANRLLVIAYIGWLMAVAWRAPNVPQSQASSQTKF
jgi:hypothetical protein